MLLSHALLHNRDVKGKRRTKSIDSGPLLLNYGRKQPSIPSSWDKAHHVLIISRVVQQTRSRLLRNLNKLQKAFGTSS